MKINYTATGSKEEEPMSQNPDFNGVPVKKIVTASTGSTVRMREAPSASAKEVRAIPIGEFVSVYNQTSEWSAIEDTRGNRGYMMTVYISDNPAAPSDQQITIRMDKSMAEALLKLVSEALARG